MQETSDTRRKRMEGLPPLDGRRHSTKDLTGVDLGGSVVLRPASDQQGGSVAWEIRCKCGGVFVRDTKDLTKSYYKRGRALCSKRCVARAVRKTHGMTNHPAYAVWRSMQARCYRENHPAFKNYGGRGITVCSEWRQDFSAFWRDMGPTYRPGLTLERVDNDQGYSPQNCVWATTRKQHLNKRTNRRIKTPWGVMPVAEAARRSGLNTSTLLYRLGSGWPAEDLFIPPSFVQRGKRSPSMTSSTAAPGIGS